MQDIFIKSSKKRRKTFFWSRSGSSESDLLPPEMSSLHDDLCLLCRFFGAAGAGGGGGGGGLAIKRGLPEGFWCCLSVGDTLEIKGARERTGQAWSRLALWGLPSLITVQLSKVMVNSTCLWSSPFLSASVFISLLLLLSHFFLRLQSSRCICSSPGFHY